MTRTQYIAMVERTRSVCGKLPFGEKILLLPTLVTALCYLMTLLYAALNLPAGVLLRVILVPTVCFGVCTLLRPLINKMRPYDRFDAEPVGRFRRGKGKSFPSRHSASVSAIACAVVRVFPGAVSLTAMTLLCAVIGLLRVVSGVHDPEDVAAGLLLSVLISVPLYGLL